MNKSELVEAVASGAGVSKADAEGVLGSFFDTVKAQAKGGDAVSWPGFGKFATTDRSARTGRNPRTGESVKVKASKAMKFTSSSVLKEYLNTKGSAKKTAAKKGPATKGSATKSTAKKAPATKSTAKKAPANSTAKAPATKSTAKKAPAKRAGR